MPKRILLADDSITIQKVVELTFSDGDYEVVAVNNGSKAIQKLAETRPDIILSDIIMPEKNGYEVCEYVKSHPEYRNIPVILLTGTFEPFDPDRADKAGCDAVVTKPFESQSLIQKVEELISQAQSASAAAPPPSPPAPEPAPSPWDDTPMYEEPQAFAAPEPARAEESPFATGVTSAGFTPAPEPFSGGFQTNDADIFSAPPQEAKTTEMPFEESELAGETRAFPRMTFEELQRMAPTPEPPAPETPSPWDEEPATPTGGETRAFPRMSFEELQQMTSAPAPAPEPAPEHSPWDEPAAAPTGSETRAFPRMSFEELQQMTSTPAPAPEPSPEPSPWDEPPAAPTGSETQAFPRMSFEELQQITSTPAAPPEPEPAPEPSPWDEPPAATGGFEELDQMSSAPEPASEPETVPVQSLWEEAPAAEEVPEWATPEPAASIEIQEEAASYTETPAESLFDSFPAETPAPVEEPEPIAAPEPEEPAWAQPEPVEEPPVAAPAPPPPPAPAPAPAAAVSASADLTEEQVDRIARRVVQLMSDQVVRNIAWEVIPDLAEMVVKERIRQLEAE